MPDNNATMSNYPNRKLAAEARCAWCDARMPAGAWVVPIEEDRALCSVSCVQAHKADSEPSDTGKADELRDRVLELRLEAEGFEEQATQLRDEADELLKKVRELEAIEHEHERQRVAEQQRLATTHANTPASFVGPEIPGFAV